MTVVHQYVIKIENDKFYLAKYPGYIDVIQVHGPGEGFVVGLVVAAMESLMSSKSILFQDLSFDKFSSLSLYSFSVFNQK